MRDEGRGTRDEGRGLNGAIVGPMEGRQQYQGCRVVVGAMAVVAATVRQWQHNNQLKKYRAVAAKGDSEGEGNGGKNNRGSGSGSGSGSQGREQGQGQWR